MVNPCSKLLLEASRGPTYHATVVRTNSYEQFGRTDQPHVPLANTPHVAAKQLLPELPAGHFLQTWGTASARPQSAFVQQAGGTTLQAQALLGLFLPHFVV